MEHDRKQIKENRAFKKEDAYETLGIINTWIGNMDTKVSFALALAGVLIGVIFEKGIPNAFERITEVSKLAELSGGEIIAAILVALLYLSSFISILCFIGAGIYFDLSFIYYIGVLIAILTLIYQHSLITPYDFSRLTQVYFMRNGIVSIVIFVFTLIDILS